MADSAILHAIGIIGEAAHALPEGVTAQQREIDWRQFGAMRNFLIHEYLTSRRDEKQRALGGFNHVCQRAAIAAGVLIGRFQRG